MDACVLELAVTRAEVGVRGQAALAALAPLLSDSARVVPSAYSTDESERYLPGARYPAVCTAKIQEDREGFTLHLPLLLSRTGGNVYVRDLHALDTVAVALYPSRPIFLLKPATDALGSPPEFHRLSRDSLARAWNVPLSVFDRTAAPASP
jgi:hypothetical protein